MEKVQEKAKRASYKSDVTDEQWAVIEPLLPPAKRGGRPRKVDLREVVNTLFYQSRTGVQWDYLPHDLVAKSTAWDYFPHDHARSRAYRWGEDGLAGFSDDEQHLCLALALWNGRDRILKECLIGLSNGEGKVGEDVKEVYYYLDATPTHSYV